MEAAKTTTAMMPTEATTTVKSVATVAEFSKFYGDHFWLLLIGE
ncbi:hypothetical protein AM1_5393 [Acaryochloris marina MBIC11017]|uniref:Uncharacterized protein n=1 Tax=Acaryochloris marina (strain MBIC 11017) TaxID=329726 RepID=B0CBU9_ACAM1|nr:hypothetical protein AM1_5393 [Acaryochloris marina MBIC11017]